MDDLTKKFCKEAAAYVRDFPNVRDLARSLDGPSKEQTNLLIEIDFLCNSFAASALTLAAEDFYFESLTLRRTLLEGQTKFLYLFLHESGFEKAFWEYTKCLPHLSMEKQVKQLNKRMKDALENNFQDTPTGKHQIELMEEQLRHLYDGLRHNKKVYKWPSDMPNPITQAENIRERWETQTILRKIVSSKVLSGFPIEELFSISSAVHHFSAESIPQGLADHVKAGMTISGNLENDANMIRECVLFGAYRQFMVASRIKGHEGARLKKPYLEIIRKANAMGINMPPECLGPYKVVRVEGNEISVVLGDLTDE